MFEFFNDSNFWVLVSFIAFVALAFYAGRKSVSSLLDSKIEAIHREVQQAESMRVEAQELLAQYQRKYKDAEKEAEEIISRAHKTADDLEKQTEANLKQDMERREKQLKERLALMEEKAVNDLRNHAADLTLRATTEIITKAISPKHNTKLNKDVIEELASHSYH
jgi:F-type H+-transporting ATPase subunit b